VDRGCVGCSPLHVPTSHDRPSDDHTKLLDQPVLSPSQSIQHVCTKLSAHPVTFRENTVFPVSCLSPSILDDQNHSTSMISNLNNYAKPGVMIKGNLRPPLPILAPFGRHKLSRAGTTPKLMAWLSTCIPSTRRLEQRILEKTASQML